MVPSPPRTRVTRVKFAAIDVGSNAVRLLLSRVFENGNSPIFKKESLVRMPIRLGEDVFSSRTITDDKADDLVNTLIAFKHLIEAYRPLDFAACATSAMREASNGEEVCRRIRERSGINLEIIDGRREAEIISSNRARLPIKEKAPFLYVDVGGGSTEITLFAEDQPIASRSFNIGTLRILNKQVTDDMTRELRTWVKSIAKNSPGLAAIGSGGNINKLFRMARVKDGKPLMYKSLRTLFNHLSKFSIDDRVKTLGLRPDRADVIVPAAELFINIMKWSKITRIYVPQIGLSDGVVHVLYERYKSGRSVPQSEGDLIGSSLLD